MNALGQGADRGFISKPGPPKDLDKSSSGEHTSHAFVSRPGPPEDLERDRELWTDLPASSGQESGKPVTVTSTDTTKISSPDVSTLTDYPAAESSAPEGQRQAARQAILSKRVQNEQIAQQDKTIYVSPGLSSGRDDDNNNTGAQSHSGVEQSTNLSGSSRRDFTEAASLPVSKATTETGHGGITQTIGETFQHAKDAVRGTFGFGHASDKTGDLAQSKQEIQQNTDFTRSGDASSDRSDYTLNQTGSAKVNPDFDDDKHERTSYDESSAGAKETMHQDYMNAKDKVSDAFDTAKEKISNAYDSAKDKAKDVGDSMKEKSENINDTEKFERNEPLTDKLGDNYGTFPTDSVYVTSVTSTTIGTSIRDDNALEAGARLGNATEQMTEL